MTITLGIAKAYVVPRHCEIAGFLVIAACAHAPSAPFPENRVGGEMDYTVTMFDDWEGARVRVCVQGASIALLVPTDDAVASNLEGAWVDGEPLETQGGRIKLPSESLVSCTQYETRFARPWFHSRDEDSVVLSHKQWLWRPDPFPEGLRATLRFVLPAGTEASLPWPRADGVYLLDDSAFFMDAYAVFGDFDREVFSVAGTLIDVVRLGKRPPAEDVQQWIDRAVRTVASVGGRFPKDRLHFVVTPVDSPAAPVAFGMVRRGGGASILLLPSSHATAGPLERDWVAIHELSHLWMPRVYLDDRWLAEGIATYLQEVLRARCGLQTSTRAWRRLREGFERGRNSGTGRRLADESRDMHRTGAYQRVYWAGAAFALEADVQLRKRSGGEQSLLTAIDGAQAAWGDEPGPVAGSQVLRSLDAATGTGFFVALGEAYAEASQFPDVSLATEPKHRAIRAQIMAPPKAGCTISGEPPR